MKQSKIREEDLYWQEVETRHLVQDEWIDFRSTTYHYPDGREFSPFYSFSRQDYVVIAATDEQGNYICVRQFRWGIRQVTNEFPAGGIEDKDSIGKEDSKQQTNSSGRLDQIRRPDPAGAEQIEKALAAAKRELSEETGYVSDEWKFLMVLPSYATMSDNYAYLFQAKNCRLQEALDLDDTECLRPLLYSKEEMEDLIGKGQFQQATNLLAWYLIQNQKDN